MMKRVGSPKLGIEPAVLAQLDPMAQAQVLANFEERKQKSGTYEFDIERLQAGQGKLEDFLIYRRKFEQSQQLLISQNERDEVAPDESIE
jgi:hypothetical protein